MDVRSLLNTFRDKKSEPQTLKEKNKNKNNTFLIDLE